jgi:hypothetical protein
MATPSKRPPKPRATVEVDVSWLEPAEPKRGKKPAPPPLPGAGRVQPPPMPADPPRRETMEVKAEWLDASASEPPRAKKASMPPRKKSAANLQKAPQPSRISKRPPVPRED